MKEHSKYLLVDSQILPEVYLKVILAKKLLAQGKAKSASDAAKAAGISRSAFYKYKDLGEALYKSNTQYLIQQQFHKVIDKKLLNYNIYTRSFYTGGIYNCLLLWISTGFKETPKEIVNKILLILKTRI